MDESLLVLLIQGASGDPGPIREALARDDDRPVRLQCVARLSTALARIAGGGVDVILLDMSESQPRGMDSLLQLLREVPQGPTFVVCGADNDGLAMQAMRAGATGCLRKEQIDAGLSSVLHSAVESARNALPPPALKMPGQRINGAIITLLGAKGGVGTTTIALNIASTLAQRSTAVLVEMCPTFGSLGPYLQPVGLKRNLSHVLNSDPSVSGTVEAAGSLWACRNVPGLRVLFGPQTAAECGEIEPGSAEAIIRSLARLADYVVVDLPASLSKANRAVIEISGSMALVVERDPVCVRSAGLMARTIESWNAVPQPIGAIIVNRDSVGCPMPLAEIDTLLGCQLLGVIPPAADSCLRAHYKGAPVVTNDPESLMAASINDLREILAPTRSAAPLRGSTSERLRV